jgi:hypothetical protein
VDTADAVWPFGNLDKLDFTGALLVGVGVVFSLSALMDGWFSDDPFPGYGRRYRACLRQRYKAETYLQKYKVKFQKEVSQARAELDDFFKSASESIDVWGRNINKIQRRFVDYSEWVDILEGMQRSGYDTYRTSHERHRLASYEAPSHFSNAPKPLINKSAKEPKHVFRDVAHSFMNDPEREKRMTLFKESCKKNHEKYSEALENAINKLKSELVELEREAECHV